jgi:hypothetical protein
LYCRLSKVRWTCWGADMRRQSRIESFMVKLYVLLDAHLLAIGWLTSPLLACPIINMYSVSDELNRICYSRWHCHVLLGQPVDGNNDCQWPSIVSCVTTTIIMWITTTFHRPNWCVTWDCCEI